MNIVLPSLGDIEEVEVTEICVAVGDAVGADDPIIVIESDKASMEVPAEQKGTVISVGVAVGDRVGAGTLIATAKVSSAEISPAAESIPEPIQKTVLPTTPQAVAKAPPERASATTERANNSGDDTVYAGPAVRRLARELGVPLEQVKGS